VELAYLIIFQQMLKNALLGGLTMVDGKIQKMHIGDMELNGKMKELNAVFNMRMEQIIVKIVVQKFSVN